MNSFCFSFSWHLSQTHSAYSFLDIHLCSVNFVCILATCPQQICPTLTKPKESNKSVDLHPTDKKFHIFLFPQTACNCHPLYNLSCLESKREHSCQRLELQNSEISQKTARHQSEQNMVTQEIFDASFSWQKMCSPNAIQCFHNALVNRVNTIMSAGHFTCPQTGLHTSNTTERATAILPERNCFLWSKQRRTIPFYVVICKQKTQISPFKTICVLLLCLIGCQAFLQTGFISLKHL